MINLQLNLSIPKVKNMESPRTGKPVANQYIITAYDSNGDLCEIFQSYKSIIAIKRYGDKSKTFLDETCWNYSRTTSKYRNEFLQENTNETKKKIKSGEYLLIDLN